MQHNDDTHGISFVVPAYNEENAITGTLTRLDEVLKTCGLPYEIILVNDGSRDRTAEMASHCKNVIVVSHPTNVGYGRAIKSGIMRAKYAWVGITDADGTYPIGKIPDLLKEMAKGFDMVIGKRENIFRQDSFIKASFRRLFFGLINLAVHGDVQDPNSGLRIFSRQLVLGYFPFLCNTFSFTTSLTIMAFGEGMFIAHIPIEYHPRVGKSKVRHLRDSLYALEIIIQGITFYNPIKFFMLFSIAIIAFVCIPAMVIALFRMHTLSLYYLVFGSLVSVLFAIGILGDIVRASSMARQMNAGKSANGQDAVKGGRTS